jgi:hypothetical protein
MGRRLPLIMGIYDRDYMKKRPDEDASRSSYSENYGGDRAETAVADFILRHKRLIRIVLIGFCLIAVVILILFEFV